ncbi:hypothetical protein FACS1894211_15420 [Clostridia bacterium]|nr:hypothetical protein FACS1894211_15420 [Clostridia bacterium]
MKLKRKIRLFLAVLSAVALTVSVAFLLSACKSVDSSTTNVQEDGVDEADIVKVNGAGYIFKAQSDGVTVSRLATAGENAGAVEVVRRSKASEDFAPQEMFLYEDAYLIVFGYKVKAVYDENGGRIGSSETMIVRVYDLKASEAGTDVGLVLLRADEFRGTYKTSRLTDGKLYLLTNYRADYDQYYVDFFFGRISFDVADGNGNGFLIAKLDLGDANGKYKTGLYAGSVYEVYCSRYALYALRSKSLSQGCNTVRGTNIDRISLDTLKKTGTVTALRGYAQDRFCLYDNGEYLFAVAWVSRTLDNKNADTRGTYLYTFNQKLEQKAKLGPIASDEQLKSARFDGDVCYIVTYRQVDPLFKIDISDPAEPRLTGELKIDGFSVYMQTFGDGLLIGMGYGASPQNLSVTLFETAGDYPDEVNSLVYQYTYAEARFNPRAILCEPENNIFAFAAEESGSDHYYVRDGRYTGIRQGAYILGLQDGELKELAFLTDLDPVHSLHNESSARKKITRVVRIGDYLLTVSDGYIASYAIRWPGTTESDKMEFERIGMYDTRIVLDTFTVTFDVGAGFEDAAYIPAPQIVDKGETAREPVPAAPEKTGYMFLYWYKNDENIKYNFDNPVRESFTLRARWQRVGGPSTAA